VRIFSGRKLPVPVTRALIIIPPSIVYIMQYILESI
jgi:hypothetical protein